MAAAGHLMQRAERQAASRQMPVDLLETEGQHQSPAAGRALEAPDALAKLLGTGTGDGCAHVLGNGLGGWYVPYLFSLGEESQSESDGGRRIERLNLERFSHFPGKCRTCGHARAIARFKRIIRLRKNQAMRQVTPTLRLPQASCEQDEKGGSMYHLPPY